MKRYRALRTIENRLNDERTLTLTKELPKKYFSVAADICAYQAYEIQIRDGACSIDQDIDFTERGGWHRYYAQISRQEKRWVKLTQFINIAVSGM